MFINCVYNEPVIHSFVVSVVSFFKQNNFYAQNFQASYLQIMEIFENLEQLYLFDPLRPPIDHKHLYKNTLITPQPRMIRI